MKRNRVKILSNQPSMTKQSFKTECDINAIMKKFQKTGAITHYANNAGSYMDVPSGDLLDAQLIIANANTMFEELPSSIRKKFENDPGQFLDFVQNEDNLEEMYELGLKTSPPLSANEPDITPPTRAPAPSTPTEPSQPSGDGS